MSELTKKIETHKCVLHTYKGASKQCSLSASPAAEDPSQCASGVAISPYQFVELPPIAEAVPPQHPAPHRGYVIASCVLTAISGLFSIVPIVTAAVGMARSQANHTEERGEIAAAVVYLFSILTIVESGLCFIAMLMCFTLLFLQPYKVLIRNPKNGSFACLCISVFLLFLCTVYTIVVHIICALMDKGNMPSAGLCVFPCVRAVALVAFFAVLVANSEDPTTRSSNVRVVSSYCFHSI
ncbi:hypothetical protein N2W54_001241 [Lotmaria passim]